MTLGNVSDLAEVFSVSRPTVYRTLNKRLPGFALGDHRRRIAHRWRAAISACRTYVRSP